MKASFAENFSGYIPFHNYFPTSGNSLSISSMKLFSHGSFSPGPVETALIRG